MKIIKGGYFPIQALFDNCVSDGTNGESLGSAEYEFIYSYCENIDQNMCAHEISLGRECWLVTFPFSFKNKCWRKYKKLRQRK